MGGTEPWVVRWTIRQREWSQIEVRVLDRVSDPSVALLILPVLVPEPSVCRDSDLHRVGGWPVYWDSLLIDWKTRNKRRRDLIPIIGKVSWHLSYFTLVCTFHESCPRPCVVHVYSQTVYWLIWKLVFKSGLCPVLFIRVYPWSLDFLERTFLWEPKTRSPWHTTL